jgi:hypothetical protein
MDPLAVVEAQLGSVDSWPPYVLRHVYAGAHFTCNEKVAAFM